MNLTDELRKLADLHQEGHLTSEEFAAAKQKLLAESRPTAPAPSTSPAEDTAAPEATAQVAEKCFQSSRWSSGNLFFPDRLTLATDGMLFRKGALFGSSEEHINYRSVASFRINNGVFLADISIETSGGSQPIFMNGLWKSEAKEIQDTIRAFQRTSQREPAPRP